MKIIIYVLTHKKFDYSPNKLYQPLLNGSALLDEDFGYIRDDTGDNISELNTLYSELTCQYWAWKNSDADIIGFCHYRRWFVKNFKFDKLTEEDIIESLKTHDIILPHNLRFTKSLNDFQKESNIHSPDYDAKYEDYVIVEQVLEKYFPDYHECYKRVMNGSMIYTNNMFICKRELANEYFEWLFAVLDKVKVEIDLSNYDLETPRVLGFFSERLLTAFVLKNNLKVKEFDLYCNENPIPHLYLFNCRFPRIQNIEYELFYRYNGIKNKLEK